MCFAVLCRAVLCCAVCCSILPREEVMSGFVDKFKQFHTNFMQQYGPHKGPAGGSNGTPSSNGDAAKH